MPPTRRLGRSDLDIFPLALGTNVFGWTADEKTSHDVLSAYTDGGGNFLDTADSYSAWIPGNTGGESERTIGTWLRSQRRDAVVIATKVSQHPDFRGLSADNVTRAAEASLDRLGTDHIDLYYAHYDDPHTPLEESVAAFSALVDAGKIRWIGLSNFTPDRIVQWCDIARREGLHAPVAVQPHYSLVERGIESTVIPVAEQEGLAVVPYYALARGFLTGKYRNGSDDSSSPRAAGAADYLTDSGRRVLSALDEVAAAHGVAVATIALAWLDARPMVAAPIDSARTVEQLPALMAHPHISLSAAEMAALDAASAS